MHRVGRVERVANASAHIEGEPKRTIMVHQGAIRLRQDKIDHGDARCVHTEC